MKPFSFTPLFDCGPAVFQSSRAAFALLSSSLIGSRCQSFDPVAKSLDLRRLNELTQNANQIKPPGKLERVDLARWRFDVSA